MLDGASLQVDVTQPGFDLTGLARSGADRTRVGAHRLQCGRIGLRDLRVSDPRSRASPAIEARGSACVTASILGELVQVRVAGSWLGSIWIAVHAAEHVAVRLPDRLWELPTLGNRLPRRPDIDLDVNMGRRSIGDIADLLVVRTTNE